MKRFFALSMIAGLHSAGCGGGGSRAQGPGSTVGGATSDLTGTTQDPQVKGAGPGETTGNPVNPPGTAAPAASSPALPPPS